MHEHPTFGKEIHSIAKRPYLQRKQTLLRDNDRNVHFTLGSDSVDEDNLLNNNCINDSNRNFVPEIYDEDQIEDRVPAYVVSPATYYDQQNGVEKDLLESVECAIGGQINREQAISISEKTKYASEDVFTDTLYTPAAQILMTEDNSTTIYDFSDDSRDKDYIVETDLESESGDSSGITTKTYYAFQNKIRMNLEVTTESERQEENKNSPSKKTEVISESVLTDLSNIAASHNVVAKTDKIKRKWDKRDYCFFCESNVLKFSRHILRHHSCETEVQEIMALKIGMKKRKILFNILRNKGNFLRTSFENIVVPIRKPTHNAEEASLSTYLPCKYCRGFYKKEYLCRHIKKCPQNMDDKNIRINAQSDGQSLLSVYQHNGILQREIFPIMRADSISLAAKRDRLICEVANRYLKSHREKQFRLVASRKMRQLSALLLEIKKEINIKNLLEALEPSNFDLLVRCTKRISKYNSENETYGAPTLAINMGTMLKECVDVAFSLTLREVGSNARLSKLKDLKELITNEWRYEISTLAISDLHQKKWNKPTLIPLAEDLALLKNYLHVESSKCLEILETNPNNIKIFQLLQELTYIQIILLNRRRVGELQRMTLQSYVDNINNQHGNEFESCITESERILMRSFKRIVIRGKRGRGVPVLFTNHMVKCTNVLVNVRDNFVQKENLYLFANLKSLNSIVGSQVIYKHVKRAGAKNPAALTSTKMRKHLATMSQIINLSQNDLEQLATFMGHTSEIHKTYYRLPNDIYQTAKVSKLLILSEKGELAKFKGKTLDEIDINLDIEEDSEDEITNDIATETLETETPVYQDTEKECHPKTKNKRILEPWTASQKEVVKEYFEAHIKNKIPPKKDECVLMKSENSVLFSNKSWQKIKIFVVNTYNKEK